MASKASKSPAPRERERLLPPALVLTFTAMVGIGMALIFPRETLRERLLAEGRAVDGLTMAYLEAWLRATPEDSEFMGVLAEQYARSGQLDAAEAMLDRMEARATVSRIGAVAAAREHALALRVRIQVEQQRAYAEQPDSPARQQHVKRLAGLLDQAAVLRWSASDLQELAAAARAIGAADAAQKFYKALAVSDPARAEYWNAQGAAVALAGGDYQEAANALFAAQGRATNIDEQRRLFLAGVRTLQSGNLLDEALAQADSHAGALLNDAEVLRYLARLALAANRPEKAASYMERLLNRNSKILGQRDDADRADGTDGTDNMAAADTPAVATARERRADRIERVAMSQPFADRGFVFLDGPRGRALLEAMGEDARPRMMRVAAASGANAGGNPAPDFAATPTPEEMASQDLELAYKVFLNAGKLNEAQRVAEAAVRKQPGVALWRERLAQVAEWNHQPTVALKAWLDYAQATGDEKAWAAVLRLAPGLSDDQAYLAALKHRAVKGDMAVIDEIIAAYERLGEPEEAMAFLQGASQGPHAREIMERHAEVAERAGKDDVAFRLYTNLQKSYGPRPAYSLKLANILFVKGKLAEALQVMLPARSKAGKNDILYWRTFNELAQLNQRDDLLEQGYREMMLAMAQKHDDHCMVMPAGAARNDCLAEVRDTEEADFSSLIAFYDKSPIDAGRIAEASWRKGKAPEQLELAINYYTRARAYGRVTALLNGLTPEQKRNAEQSARFLALRAEYLRVTGDREGSLVDLRRAAGRPNADSETLAALMWSLVDLGSDTEVRSVMQRLKSQAEGNPDLWGAFAAGSMRFQDGRTALHYLRKMADGRSGDPLWLSLMADAYESIGEDDLAWRLRRRAWQDLHGPQMASASRSAGDDEDEDALGMPTRPELQRQMVALGQTFASGDVSRNLVIELLRADRLDMSGTGAAAQPVKQVSKLGDIPGLPPLQFGVPETVTKEAARRQSVVNASAKEVALAWAMSAESNDLARAWLARQYARQLQRPAYAEVTLALANNDLNALDRVLERQAGRIPINNQIEAAVQLDRLDSAQTLAYDAQDRARTDDSLQETLQDTLLADAMAIEPRYTYQRQRPLAYNQATLMGGVRLWRGFDLQLRGDWRTQRSTDSSQLANVPSRDRRGELSLGYRDSRNNWRVGVGERQGLNSVTTARFAGEWMQDSRVSFTTLAGVNQQADESAALRVGGVKNVLSLGTTWRPSLREFVGARVEYDRFRGQDGTWLGSGMVYDLEAGYRIRTQYPDYTVRVVGTHANYRTSGGTLSPRLSTLVPADDEASKSFYMPQNFTQAGVVFGFGDQLLDDYTHKWRPFMELGALYDTRAGHNFRTELGIAGTVLGNDHLAMYVRHETASRNGGTPLTELGMRYRWLF